jgi:hypothetical protein
MRDPKNIIILSLLLLLLVSGGLNIFQNSLRKNDRIASELSEARNQTEIAASRALAKSYADRAREVDSVRTLERDSAKVVVRALKQETTAYKKTIAVLRPLVAPRIDSVPVLRDFVAAQDSTILKQDSTITVLEVAVSNEIGRAAEIDLLKRNEIGELVSMVNGLQNDLVTEQGKTRKAEKKAGKKFSVGPTAGYGFSKEGLSPQIGISVQWRWLRF